jgi:hypothetical protein
MNPLAKEWSVWDQVRESPVVDYWNQKYRELLSAVDTLDHADGALVSCLLAETQESRKEYLCDLLGLFEGYGLDGYSESDMGEFLGEWDTLISELERVDE